MKKILFVLAIVFLFAATAQAQVGFGVKGGMTIAKLTGDDTDDLDSRSGFTFGAYAEMPIGESMSFQPGFTYVQKGAEYDWMVGEDTFSEKAKFDYIEIPLLFKYTVAGEGVLPYFLVGPTISFNSKAEIEGNDTTDDVSDEIKSTDFGLAFGVGVEIQQFLIEARYTLGLANILDVPDEADYDPSWKNSVISIQAGFNFTAD